MSEDAGSVACSVDDLEDGGRKDAAISSAASLDSDLETNQRTDTADVSVSAPDIDLLHLNSKTCVLALFPSREDPH